MLKVAEGKYRLFLFKQAHDSIPPVSDDTTTFTLLNKILTVLTATEIQTSVSIFNSKYRALFHGRLSLMMHYNISHI